MPHKFWLGFGKTNNFTAAFGDLYTRKSEVRVSAKISNVRLAFSGFMCCFISCKVSDTLWPANCAAASPADSPSWLYTFTNNYYGWYQQLDTNNCGHLWSAKCRDASALGLILVWGLGVWGLSSWVGVWFLYSGVRESADHRMKCVEWSRDEKKSEKNA